MLFSVAPILVYFVLPCLFLVAGIFDVLTGRIPDWIVITLGVAFFAFAILSGWQGETILDHVLIALVVFVAGFGLFWLGWVGGGDGKLAAIGALWFGPSSVLDFLSLSFIFGGLLVAIVFLFRVAPLPAPVLRQPWIQRWIGGKEGLPFGVAMAAAVLVLRQIGFDFPTP